jgi:uncharacterized protein YutE (UPF0331/DUF86 family)
MADDVVLNKLATIERCVVRVREEYDFSPTTFATNFSRQDAAILNIQRACEAALDVGQHLIRRDKLGVVQSSRDVFESLRLAGYIDDTIATAMKNMIGFRNVAVHDYQRLQTAITISVITLHLHEFAVFSKQIMVKSKIVGGVNE